MKNSSTRILGAVLISGFAVPALAGSLDAPAEQPTVAPVVIAAPANDWTGGYVGAQLGYGNLSGGDDDILKGDDWVAGLNAGYDWDLGDWVVGLGADANFGKIETSAGDLDSLSRVKARGGYDFGNTLLFVSAGASYAASEDLQDSWGYFGGLGVETMVTDTVSVSAEISQHRFDSYQDFGAVDATVGTLGVNYRF